MAEHCPGTDDRATSSCATDRDIDGLSAFDREVIVDFRGYPLLVHKRGCRRFPHPRPHVRGYTDKYGIGAPLGLAMAEEVDRFSSAIDAIELVRSLLGAGVPVAKRLRDARIECRRHADDHGVDPPRVAETWHGGTAARQ